MLRYVIKRILHSLIVMLIVVFVAFLIVRLMPGDPARLLLPDTATEEEVDALRTKMGLDKPIFTQFVKYILGLLQGDFGMSTQYNQPTLRVIANRLPATGRLAFAVVAVVALIGIPLGIFAGVKRGKGLEVFVMGFAMLGQSISSMWLGVLMIYVFSVKLGWLPALGSGGIAFYIMPVISLAFPMSASIIRNARAGMADTLSEDYITATYAKGVNDVSIYLKYALRNALIPVVIILGFDLGAQLSGAVVAETVFSMTGIGSLMSSSVNTQDYAMVQTLLLVSSFFFTMINFIVDLINARIDPRLTLN